MSTAYIPNALRERIAQQAKYRCGYCLSAEAIVGTRWRTATSFLNSWFIHQCVAIVPTAFSKSCSFGVT
jgi:hypothetical protein